MNQFDLIVCSSCGKAGLAFPPVPFEMQDHQHEEFMKAGGFTRAGTEIALCRKCDPLDWDNLTEEEQALMTRALTPIRELVDLGISRQDALDIYLNAAEAEQNGEDDV